MSKFVFSSPRKYIQGAGMITQLGENLADLGNSAFIVADKIVWGLIGEQVQESLSASGVEFHYEEFNGEASSNEITRLAKLAKSSGTAVVVGLGGG